MAIVLEEKKAFPLGTVLMLFFVAAVLIGGAYYMFLAAAPGIEVIIPKEQQNVSQLSRVKLDSSLITNDPAFKVLRQYSTVPSGVQPGNLKPFVKF